MRLRSDILLTIDSGVYEPCEDSYLLLDSIDTLPGERFLEVGTGSGIIALHAAAAGARVVATDLDPRAARCAENNAKRNSLEVDVVITCFAAGIRGRFDLVVFNPPYLPAELGLAPDARETGGERGDETSLRFLQALPLILSPAGRAYLLTSSLHPSDAITAAANGEFAMERVGKAALFFEELSVLKLTTLRHDESH